MINLGADVVNWIGGATRLGRAVLVLQFSQVRRERMVGIEATGSVCNVFVNISIIYRRIWIRISPVRSPHHLYAHILWRDRMDVPSECTIVRTVG